MPGQLGEIEDAVAGEVRALLEPGNGRRHRQRRNGDNEAASTDRHIAGHHRALVLEPCLAVDETHAEPGKARRRLVRRERLGDARDVLAHLGEIGADDGRAHADSAAAAHRSGSPRGRDERRQAALQFACGLPRANERDRSAAGGGGNGGGGGARAATDNTDVSCDRLRHRVHAPAPSCRARKAPPSATRRKAPPRRDKPLFLNIDAPFPLPYKPRKIACRSGVFNGSWRIRGQIARLNRHARPAEN